MISFTDFTYFQKRQELSFSHFKLKYLPDYNEKQPLNLKLALPLPAA